MKKNKETKISKIDCLCASIKELIQSQNYTNAFKMIYEAMAQFPDNPEPHNLLGILLEKRGNHVLAMKHFQVAWVLDPTYKPVDRNLTNFSSLHPDSTYAYSEEDCPKEKEASYKIVYDDRHVGHMEKNRLF